MTTYDKIIQEYLFQLLLTNFAEVKKLQEHASKDSILGYLLLKEIKEKLPNPDISESILGGISTPTGEELSQSTEEVWQSIDMCLKNIWGFNLNDISTYTTSTALKQIIESKTYTYSTMLQAISLATVHLRKSSNLLWNEMLSDLIVIKENTKYARINNENESTVITESGTAHLSPKHQENGGHFAFECLRGTSRPEVFPFGETTGTTNAGFDQNNTKVASTLRSRYGTGTGSHIQQLNSPKHSNDRVYGADGVSPTLNTMQGGNRQPFITDPQGRKTKVCNPSPIANTLRANTHGNEQVVNNIRRLTPTECERLQGFPDGWTEGISDSQRYKCCGNAVTVNVIRDLFLRVV